MEEAEFAAKREAAAQAEAEKVGKGEAAERAQKDAEALARSEMAEAIEKASSTPP